MPRNRTSDDVDHIPTDSASQKNAPKPVPKPAPVPDYDPLNIDFTNGIGNLPLGVTAQQPYKIFSLFFSEIQLQQLADSTNLYAQRAEEQEKLGKEKARRWFPTTTKELRAYIGIWIYMGLNRDLPVDMLWNTSPQCCSQGNWSKSMGAD